MKPMNILHVFRAPVGGLFRHVLDLTREQIARGHRVGLIADLRTGGTRADDTLRALEPSLALGLTRIPMRRHANPGDLFVLARVVRRAAQAQADVVHGHGAKGGAYARLSFGTKRAVRAYTPHGGSLLFGHDTLAGKFYLATARLRDAGRTVTATLVGDGPEREALQAQVARHGLGGAVHFMPAMPARQALALGRIMVVPSRTESLPYVVLESAAGGKPLITTKVGGIPEIYGPLSNTLVPPVDAAALAQAISHMLDHPDATAEIARQLRGQVQAAFSVDIMVDGVLSAYQTAIEAVRKTGRG